MKYQKNFFPFFWYLHPNLFFVAYKSYLNANYSRMLQMAQLPRHYHKIG